MKTIEIIYTDYVAEATETKINGWLAESEHRRVSDSVIRISKDSGEWVIERCGSILPMPSELSGEDAFSYSLTKSACIASCLELKWIIELWGFEGLCENECLIEPYHFS